MSNPYLPLWEYVPDGEPRVFGNRIYIYGSHDMPGSDCFCDYKLKVWSAPVDNPTEWVCHGHAFHTLPDRDHSADIEADAQNRLFAPDVVEKDGKYYLYVYIFGAKGCVAVSERPEGPFELLSRYDYDESEGNDSFRGGWFIDPGVLVDDDGRVYIYCGYEGSFAAEINADNMYEIKRGSFVEDILPKNDDEPWGFFEACSPRKIGDTYYLVYSPRIGSRLAYATSRSPLGPFEYRGYIVDNGVDYPGGNDHGSICKIGEQWYIFYHRMTNGTIMSRRGCVERIEIAPDGSIAPVEMTSLGFAESLNPYTIIKAETACVLIGGCYVTETDVFTRFVTNITRGCVLGWKYFDFGDDYSTKTMRIALKLRGCGCASRVRVMLDDPEKGIKIGEISVGVCGGVCQAVVDCARGRHSLFFVTETDYGDDWTGEAFAGKRLFELEEFVFLK